jgi:hypothetical protein
LSQNIRKTDTFGKAFSTGPLNCKLKKHLNDELLRALTVIKLTVISLL